MKKILLCLFLVCVLLFSCSPDEDFSQSTSSFESVSLTFEVSEETSFAESETESVISSTTEKNEYILNKNTRIFHYPSCFCIDRMSEKNKKVFEGSREDVLRLGYNSCGHCCP